MPHLSYTCHGDEHCLDKYAGTVSTLKPSTLLPQENFVPLTIEEQGLLDIACHACLSFSVINSPLVCESSAVSHRHPMKLIVTEDSIVRVLNDDYGLFDCTCGRSVCSAPRSLSRCLLSAWAIWLEKLRRWEALMNLPDYRSPSPDLPELSELFSCITPRKRAVDKLEEDSGSSVQPPPAKRVRVDVKEVEAKAEASAEE
ncbi:hypothetical protein V5O48_014342 [Marasmius crinis-equi]|uniref:Uncharacterized protein n=1 Tax=Marasmius crinis-equi TaxID=585013 RepID=A0ABR3EXM0_9AGAR